MANPLIKTAVRLRFRLTTRAQADRQIRRSADKYLSYARRIDPAAGARVVTVPRMLGVDEDMRDWSFYMLLEHNVIVSRAMSAIALCLARGDDPDTLPQIDPKRDVMPSANPGPEQVDALDATVTAHLDAVAGLKKLRGTATRPHPLFGDFDAHAWHCMFRFHLGIHLRQARMIVTG